MENIVFAVIPVRERSMIAACLLDGLRRTHNLLVFLRRRLAFLTLEPLLVRSFKIHSVRVNDLCFLLQVEGLFVVLDVCLREFVVIVLFVVRIKRLRVGVAHESINASCLPRTLVTRRQSLKRCVRPD